MTQSPQPGEILSVESVKLLLDCLRGPHEWGYRCPVEGGFIADDRPYQAADVIQRQGEEIERLRESVITFLGPWAVSYAKDRHPEGHLHPVHYDLLESCGARMDDFTRARQGGPDHG